MGRIWHDWKEQDGSNLFTSEVYNSIYTRCGLHHRFILETGIARERASEQASKALGFGYRAGFGLSSATSILTMVFLGVCFVGPAKEKLLDKSFGSQWIYLPHIRSKYFRA
jgi:hypothetical protein